MEPQIRTRHVLKIVLACVIAILIVSTANIGVGQTTGTASSAKKYIIFRCDDVAPKEKFVEFQAVSQLHIDKNVPVTLGIVPHPMTGTGNELLADSQFASYVKSLASNHLFEFAQHGYTHQGTSALGPSEFYGRPYAAQYDAIKKGRDDIRGAWGVTPTTFIPPFDKGDNNTLKATKALGFTQYSTSFRDFNVSQGSKGGMRIEAVSLILANETLQSAESKTNQFLADTHSINTFVVLYHPADFSSAGGSVDKEKTKLLGNYIDYLKGRDDVQFTRVDHAWTTGNATSNHPISSTGSAQQTSPLPDQVSSTLIEGLQGSFNLLPVGTILVLVLGAYLVLFRGNWKRRSR